MNTLTSIDTRRVMGVVAHPDDTEMMHFGLLSQADKAFAYIATAGEASTTNPNRRSVC